MAIMNRQPGVSWTDVGRMDIEEFFYVLQLSEKQVEKIDEKLKRKK